MKVLQKCAPKWQPRYSEFGFECFIKCGYLGAQAINFVVCAQIKTGIFRNVLFG